jgi:plasmid stabilization system protein ParE
LSRKVVCRFILRDEEDQIMPRGSKEKYTDKQKRQAEHIEEGYKEQGVSEDEAEARAWATVNAVSGGGKKSGSGRGKKVNKSPMKKGGRKGGKATAKKKKASSRKKKAAGGTKAQKKRAGRKGGCAENRRPEKEKLIIVGPLNSIRRGRLS